MSDNNNTMTAALPDDFDGDKIVTESIKWNTKGQKITYGNVGLLLAGTNRNVRFRIGEEFFGIKCDVDTYDIPSMCVQVVDGGGIQEPIWVSERPDGVLFVMRGNRRALAGQTLLDDPHLSVELREALTKRTPMIVLKGLSPDQEQELINDQTQKSFLRSEIVRSIFELRKARHTFKQIAYKHWEQLGNFTGSTKIAAEVRAITDPAKKRERIDKWLKGTLETYLLNAYDLGPVVQKATLLSVMATDNLLKEGGERPYFNTEKDSQNRMRALKAAKELDGDKWNGTILIEGSKFKEALDKFAAEDYGPGAGSRVKDKSPVLKKGEIEELKGTMVSKVGQQVLDRILGNTVPTMTARDEWAGAMEVKLDAADQYRNRLTKEARELLNVFLYNPDHNDFLNWLESHVDATPDQA